MPVIDIAVSEEGILVSIVGSRVGEKRGCGARVI